MIKAITISTFVHGASTYRPGDQAEFSLPVFSSLAGYGLVREAGAKQAEQNAPVRRAAAKPANKKAPEPDNKNAPEPGNKGDAVQGDQTGADSALAGTGDAADGGAAAGETSAGDAAAQGPDHAAVA